ncbi:hypothetical protein [uncultured Acidaminococcus sp.]|uniref:hypothetical protein n=1 Tax=uncultured Acidaminococcus sp. TaxID=352152 RepID=UPI002804A489|nr:hypothetical protein [uncultured Acidaminococcus sp.]
MVKRFIAFCLLLLLSCTVVQAEPESRWKWYYSSDRVGMYFDTQTLHYDASKRAADVWTKNLNVNGEKIREVHKFLFLEEGAAANVQYVYYRNGYPSVHNVKKVYIQQVAPDSPNEALANGIANYLNVKPMYPGGETGGNGSGQRIHTACIWQLTVGNIILKKTGMQYGSRECI